MYTLMRVMDWTAERLERVMECVMCNESVGDRRWGMGIMRGSFGVWDVCG